ncbi:uncharacterized protein LOC117198470 isoform X1 [Orcinus orca]|uniref:uncharacterized protein LOC117198470 isoform X1 n=1 Tax=Orcinus orca TaxID=9733 RepID=UPI00144227F9|nr:uncharacterized protein LOC117198470 isoform X1 [Orcinus orca]
MLGTHRRAGSQWPRRRERGGGPGLGGQAQPSERCRGSQEGSHGHCPGPASHVRGLRDGTLCTEPSSKSLCPTSRPGLWKKPAPDPLAAGQVHPVPAPQFPHPGMGRLPKTLVRCLGRLLQENGCHAAPQESPAAVGGWGDGEAGPLGGSPSTPWQPPRQAWECDWREQGLSPRNQRLGASQGGSDPKRKQSSAAAEQMSCWGRTQAVKMGLQPQPWLSPDPRCRRP